MIACGEITRDEADRLVDELARPRRWWRTDRQFGRGRSDRGGRIDRPQPTHPALSGSAWRVDSPPGRGWTLVVSPQTRRGSPRSDHMSTIIREVVIEADATSVWDALRDFGALHEK